MPKSEAATMITNNNLDYDQASASSTIIAGAATTTAGTAATSVAMSNRNGSTSSSSNSSPTADNSNSNSNSNTHSNASSNSNANINRNLNQNSNSNSNSYFNRFDNRIAANLAAVLTGAGARFRSSSCNNRQPAGVANPPVLRSPLATISRRTSLATPPSPASLGRRRPLQLFTHANLNCNDNEKVAQTPSSDEDNSPTELNSCKRLADKPPLVKRLTMGLLRQNEESRPLVGDMTPLSAPLDIQPVYSNGYINEDSYIDSKFGDSCRQSLTAIPMLDNVNLNDNNEFNLKKRYLRETSSANSSPKIFANRLRMNQGASGQRCSSLANAFGNVGSEEEDLELKDACWYQAGISRDIAVEVLQSKSPGAFLVRKSSSKPGCYALTLRVPSPPGPKIANYIILKSPRGYKIKGFRKEFSSLKALITHHSVMPELLPVPLAMPRPTNMSSSRRNLDDFDTYDSLQMLLKYLRAKNMETEQQQ
ncbi:serine/threonine-protein kinase phg2 isoform X2 [Drosophila erecta]|uniref:Uncharacterized protein, isoform A n=1 Tax=Drosophila erecta TaxID=7220 RepID=B3NCB9_DROER|nr:serine/threonine-protein kinase phg2 isoform X2 [Drosophila erecta]EDV51077.1 uncharacterized protein Dere_GG15304, isoform A [Drosophila erecta]